MVSETEPLSLVELNETPVTMIENVSLIGTPVEESSWQTTESSPTGSDRHGIDSVSCVVGADWVQAVHRSSRETIATKMVSMLDMHLSG